MIPDLPHCIDIVKYTISETNSPRDYDYSWIQGEVLALYVCQDGLVIIVYEGNKLGENK